MPTLFRSVLTAVAAAIWFVIVKNAFDGWHQDQSLIAEALAATVAAPQFVASLWLWHP